MRNNVTCGETKPESHVNGKHLLDIVRRQFICWIRVVHNLNTHHVAHLLNLLQSACILKR